MPNAPHIDDADAAQLDIVADHLRRGADQLVRDAADLHRVVRHQPVAPHDELDGRFALADAGVAGDHHTLAGDVQQHAVAGDAGSQHPVQIFDRWLVNSTVVSWVRNRVRSWPWALSRHSGKHSRPREITRAGMS